ncbi:hypothetical protein JVU11DRAFT_3831 [Chiua virens]|nr:hypothetical protein JVU11DRAFT_3831 [Chiua virens]
MLTFAPKEFVGYDPTIFFSPVIDRCLRLRHSPTIRIGDEEYIITRLIFSSDSIREESWFHQRVCCQDLLDLRRAHHN